MLLTHAKSKRYHMQNSKVDSPCGFSESGLLVQIHGHSRNLLNMRFRSPATLNFMIKMTYIVRLVFSVKPLVDALCTLLFLGEYRQYTINFWKLIRGKKDGATTTRVTEFQRKPAPTRSAMPSAATGHVTSLQNGIRSPGMPRSSSLPVTIKTISTS